MTKKTRRTFSKSLKSIACLTIALGTLTPVQLMAKTTDQISSEFTTILSTGLFYSSGQSDTINSSDSTTKSVPLMISVKNGRLSFGLSTAYLSVKTDTFKADGMGDTTLSIAYDIMESPWLTVKLKEKLATGDKTEGLSTGKNDTSVQLDYFYPLQNNTSVFATIGHKFVGKVTGSAMQDTQYASIGMGYLYPNKINIGLSLDYRQSTFKDLDDQTGASVFVSKALNNTNTLSAFGGYDRSETTSAGVTLTTKF